MSDAALYVTLALRALPLLIDLHNGRRAMISRDELLAAMRDRSDRAEERIKNKLKETEDD